MKNKLRFLLITIFFLRLTFVGAGQLPAGNWKLLPENSDEFEGSLLDTLKWSDKVGYPVSRVFAFRNENISVKGGNLRLTSKKEEFKGKSYTSAWMESKFSDPGNGSFVEIRAKVIDFRVNICCAIWEQNFPGTRAFDPNPEIDIQEFLLSPDPNKVDSHLHRWPVKPGIHTMDGAQSWRSPVPLCYDFHNYGLERRDGKLRFYLDGVKYWEYDVSSMPEYVTMPRHVIFSLEGHSGNPVDSYLPASFLIDYVRVYKIAESPK